jgi:hypothetical protein
MPKRQLSGRRILDRTLHWYPVGPMSANDAPDSKSQEDEIQSIIDAVGLHLATSKRELSYDIGVAASRYCDVKGLGARRQKYEDLDSIAKCAKRLKRLLDDQNAWQAITSHLPSDISQAFSRGALVTLIEAADKARGPRRIQNAAEKKIVDETIEDLSKQSPFEMLVGELCKVFEKNFGTLAQVNRPKNKENDTPYIRFVIHVLKTLQLPGSSRESIIRATTIAKSGRGRRKAEP